jgi:hypothetical protein
MFKDLFETESLLKLIFLSQLYETESKNVWGELHSLSSWTRLLRRERQILSTINNISLPELSWLDLVNLYGYVIGEDVFMMRKIGLSTELSRLPGNHPHRFQLSTLKGFDTTIEKGGSLTSYYCTYAIEGVCTFSYIALRNGRTHEKMRRELVQELDYRLIDSSNEPVLREKRAVRQILSLGRALGNTSSTTLTEDNIIVMLRHTKRIISNLLPSINKWIYLTYAETNKRHGYVVKRMSTRFSHATLVSPDFGVSVSGNLTVESLPTLNLAKKNMEPKEKTLGFFKNSVLPKIECEDYKQLATQYLLKLKQQDKPISPG